MGYWPEVIPYDSTWFNPRFRFLRRFAAPSTIAGAAAHFAHLLWVHPNRGKNSARFDTTTGPSAVARAGARRYAPAGANLPGRKFQRFFLHGCSGRRIYTGLCRCGIAVIDECVRVCRHSLPLPGWGREKNAPSASRKEWPRKGCREPGLAAPETTAPVIGCWCSAASPGRGHAVPSRNAPLDKALLPSGAIQPFE